MESWNVSQGGLLLKLMFIQVAATSWGASASGCSAGWRSDASRGSPRSGVESRLFGKERKRQDACAETRPPSASVLSSIVVVRSLFGEVKFFFESVLLDMYIYIYLFFYSEVFAAINLPCLQQTTSASFQVCYIWPTVLQHSPKASFPSRRSLTESSGWKVPSSGGSTGQPVFTTH